MIKYLKSLFLVCKKQIIFDYRNEKGHDELNMSSSFPDDDRLSLAAVCRMQSTARILTNL
jgi:hypothetical protein